MRLFVGLGNPGSEYKGNRHNIGFMVLDAIARRHGFSPWRRRFAGETSEGMVDRKPVFLLKPMTFMNESGRAVRQAAESKYFEPADVTVFHDELELPLGKLRVKVGGGNAGHNGLRSTSELFSNEFKRVRIGIGRPGTKDLVHRHVLSDFAKSEFVLVDAICECMAEFVGLLVEQHDAEFQNKVHLAMQAKGFHVEGRQRLR